MHTLPNFNSFNFRIWVAVGVAVVHVGLSAVSDCAIVRKVRETNGMQELRTEEDSLELRQLVGSVGGTCHFGDGIQICMLSIQVTNVCCFILLGMRGCSLEKINLAICISICKVGLLFAPLPWPALRVLLPP